MNTNDSFKAIADLNLDAIKVKLMHRESGEGWSLEKANAVEFEYRRFLILMKQFPQEETAPLMDVDTFWHYHILDTMKYAADCDRVFGYFLHHYPYVGMRGEEDEQFRLDSGDRMRELYESTFGDAYPGALAAAGNTEAQAAYCAGPHAEAAYCAGPHAEAAYCAGPHAQAKRAEGAVAATAYCAGPHAEAAYCAGPHAQAKRTEGAVAATAYCAGPHAQASGKAGASATAYCAGPHASTAYCAGPHAQARGKADANATAYCAGPHATAASGDGKTGSLLAA